MTLSLCAQAVPLWYTAGGIPKIDGAASEEAQPAASSSSSDDEDQTVLLQQQDDFDIVEGYSPGPGCWMHAMRLQVLNSPYTNTHGSLSAVHVQVH